jgi:hypothetical protein
MKALKLGTLAAACAASATLSSLVLFLSSARILGSGSLVQSLALIAMSVLGSGLIALMEFRSSELKGLKSRHRPLPTQTDTLPASHLGAAPKR